MKVRGFARDPLTGSMIPPGMTEVTYRQSFLNGETLPPWLQSVGTVAAAAWGTGTPGGITVSTAATLDSEAILRTPVIPQDQFAAIAVEFKGLRFTNMYTSLLSLGVHALNTTYGGAMLIQRENDDWASFNIPGQGTTEYGRTGYTLRTLGESVKQRNIGFLYNCRTRTALVYEDDPAHPFGTLDVGTSLVQGGPVSAQLRLRTRNAQVQSFRVAEAVLRLWPEAA